jgi:hypothetical protein
LRLALKIRARPQKWKELQERKIEHGSELMKQVAARLQIAEHMRKEGVTDKGERDKEARVAGVSDEAVAG